MNAQTEIRDVIHSAYTNLCKKNRLFKKSAPPCISGKCPEGAYACGNRGEVVERYGIKKDNDDLFRKGVII